MSDPVPAIIRLNGSTGADRSVLGGKAWSIDRMLSLGMPVPPAFVLTTEECRRYYRAGRRLPGDTAAALAAAVAALEETTERGFGGGKRPLLLSVRSGAAVSMPGMLDTVLNVGMTNEVERALAEDSGDPGYAADTRRRFVAQYRAVVGADAPAAPAEQLARAIEAVFDSWNSRRAVAYRRDRGISDRGGTAVTVQSMVFGNLDDRSGSGVLFTRDPLTGGSEPYGEWLPRGQGEDVVSGRFDALPLRALAEAMPDPHRQLLAAAARLESDARDVQDVEFTVERGTLWLLQARDAKRSPEAVVRHAVLLQREGLIDIEEALDRVSAEHVETMLHPGVAGRARAAAAILAKGRPACPGVATGTLVVDLDEAERRAVAGENVVLARPTTEPDDVAVMSLARAVVTELGGTTSHAAVVCRELGVPCVVGCGEDALTPLAGRRVTVDATTGEVFDGVLPVTRTTESDDPALAQLAAWARAEAGADNQQRLSELLRARAGRRPALR